MENWENKIIAEKLNSLQTLPKGYNPDMLSKWEIIEAGLPKEKSKIIPLNKWMVIAAVIIGVVFFSVNILSINKQKQVTTQLPINKIKIIAITKQLNKKPDNTIKLIEIEDLNPTKIIVKNKILAAKKENKKALIEIEIPVLNNANLNKITQS